MSSTMNFAHAAVLNKDFWTMLFVGASYAIAKSAMKSAQAAILDDPEFWTMLFAGTSLAMSPIIGHWLLSKDPSTTVYLFAACLSVIPAGTNSAGLGPVHLVYTPLAALASWAMCVSVVALLDMVCRAVAACVSSACRAVVALASSVLAFRKCTTVVVVAASLAFPAIGDLVVVGLALWVIHQVVQALVYLVQRVHALVCAACAAVDQAADRALRGVEAAAAATHEMMLSTAWSILAFRKCMVAVIVAASLVCPPFGEWVVMGLVVWATYQLVQALVCFVQRVDALARAAVEAVKEPVDLVPRVVKYAVFAVGMVLSAARSILATLFWGTTSILAALFRGATSILAALFRAAMSLLHSTFSLLRKVLATLFWGAMCLLRSTLSVSLKLLVFYLKTASVVLFLIEPSADTFAFALLIKVGLALLKYAVED